MIIERLTMKINNKAVLLISLIAISGFLFMFIPDLLQEPERLPQEELGKGFRKIPVQRMVLTPILLIIGISAIAYYTISKKVDNNTEILLKFINKNGKAPKKKTRSNKEAVLKFLNHNERKALEKLIEKNGSALQSDVSNTEGMTKLKAHRAIKDLQRKGIIKLEPHGKTKKIYLVKEAKDFLLE